ncbi:MAG: outer membrane lipoprotein chaperone LolA [Thiogranum sp.]|jgi:outer membrane lipoprotein carrier protein
MPSLLHIRPRTRGLWMVLCLLAGLTPVVVQADLVSDYFSGLETIQADFVQTVVDSGGETVQDSQGHVWMQRPGRFRWDYRTPYHQLIVADGKRLWTYDEDLEQATVKDLDAALSSTPAMLLSGYRPLAEVMDWEPDSDNDRYTWFRLHPKERDSAVEKVRIAFDGGELAIIEVVDGFGNHTRIRFSNMRRNQKLDDGLFQLKLPEGTDIIGAAP